MDALRSFDCEGHLHIPGPSVPKHHGPSPTRVCRSRPCEVPQVSLDSLQEGVGGHLPGALCSRLPTRAPGPSEAAALQEDAETKDTPTELRPLSLQNPDFSGSQMGPRGPQIGAWEPSRGTAPCSTWPTLCFLAPKRCRWFLTLTKTVGDADLSASSPSLLQLASSRLRVPAGWSCAAPVRRHRPRFSTHSTEVPNTQRGFQSWDPKTNK